MARCNPVRSTNRGTNQVGYTLFGVVMTVHIDDLVEDDEIFTGLVEGQSATRAKTNLKEILGAKPHVVAVTFAVISGDLN